MTPPEAAAQTQQDIDIIKCRDDHQPIALRRTDDGLSAEFELVKNGPPCSWAKPGERIRPDRLRGRIEPWLTALCQSDHLSLLLGSGLTTAVHIVARGERPRDMGKADFGEFGDTINGEAKKSAIAAGRADGNIEDQIRVANELLRGLEILGQTEGAMARKAATLRAQLASILKDFSNGVLAGERGLLEANAGSRERAFNYLVSFLMSFASRTGTRDRLQIFTTNYDRYIEAGAEAAGLHLLDRFVGTLAPVFRSSRLDLDLHYNPPGIRGEPRYLEGVARFSKLHGSLDWVDHDRSIRRLAVPFGTASITTFLNELRAANGSADPDAANGLMIFPNSAKDRETSFYPYVELFRDFAAAACRPNHTLFAFGYGFGDDHINRVIEDMLTIPSTHLVVISRSDPIERIKTIYDRLGRPAQITLLVGSHVGDFVTLIDNYLPKPAIDRTTFRMAELLKSRWRTNGHEVEDGKSTAESTKTEGA